jgi:hypothetical protein
MHRLIDGVKTPTLLIGALMGVALTLTPQSTVAFAGGNCSDGALCWTRGGSYGFAVKVATDGAIVTATQATVVSSPHSQNSSEETSPS